MTKYLALLVLAAGMGIPAAFFTIALPGMMRDGGASLMETGLVYLVWLPSVAKVVWAGKVEPYVNQYKQRKAAIVLLALSIGLSFLPVAWLAAYMASGPLLFLAVVSASISLTLHLILAGWCMAFLNDKERSIATGFMAAGMILGGVLGGGVSPTLANAFGWPTVIVLLALLISVTGIASICLQGTTEIRPETTFRLSDAIKVYTREKGSVRLVMTVLIASTGAVDMTLAVRLVDAGFSPERSALILGTVATLLMVPATLLVGFAGRRWRPAYLFALICLCKSVILAGLGVLDSGDGLLIAVLAVGEFICAGALTVMTWQFYMHCSRGDLAVSGFAMMTATDALFRMLLGIAAGTVGVLLGLTWLFALVALLNLAIAVGMVFVWTSLAPKRTAVYG